VDQYARPVDSWRVVFTAMSVGTLGLLLVGDRYVELLAAGVAYAATWAIVRHETPDREEQTR
jgi:hypothetical protein